MKIDRYEVTKKFEKTFNKLRSGEQKRVTAAPVAAGEDLLNPMLRVHELKGAMAGTVSLNAGGDLRILCRLYGHGQSVALLLVVGTHSQLYS